MKLEKIDLELTSKCNLRCEHCYANSKRNGIDMPVDIALRIINEFSDIGGNRIALTGGEPTLHKNFIEIFNYAAEMGLRIELETNGFFFYKFAEDISKKREFIKYVQISLDAVSSKIHDEIRGIRGSFKKAVNAIKICNSFEIPVRVSTVLSKKNKNEIDKMIKLLQKFGVSDYRVDVVVPTGRAINNGICAKEYAKIIKKFLNSNDKVVMPSCGVGYSRVAVLADGKITPCPMLRELIVGNAFNFGELSKSLNSDVVKKVREGLEKSCGKCEKKNICGKGCKARAYAITKNLNASDPYRCALFKNFL
ncbi:MAG: radical SAM protein [Candidatus Altiarchaeota archaeon]